MERILQGFQPYYNEGELLSPLDFKNAANSPGESEGLSGAGC